MKVSLSHKIAKNEPLSAHTNIRIGGPADYFLKAVSEEEIVQGLLWAKGRRLAVTLLGEGSNVLISDEGVRGLVIKIANKDTVFEGTKVRAGAGHNLTDLVNKTVDRGLSGLEFACGIYGNVGGAIRGNAGSFGREMRDVVEKVKVWRDPLQTKENHITWMGNKECAFAYRHSAFKEHPAWVILSAVLQLEKGDREKGRKQVKELLKKKLSTQPLDMPSSGCFFKNVSVTLADVRDMEEKGLDVSSFVDKKVIPAAFLIDQAGLKGKTIGRARVSDKHPNFIINLGGAKAREVVMLVSVIKQQVRDRFGIQLHEEVQYVGF